MTTAEKLTRIAENQQVLYDTGHAVGVDLHMRGFQRRGNMNKNYLYAFAGPCWMNTASVFEVATYCPTEDMVFNCDLNASNMYTYSGVTDTIAAIDMSRATGNVKTAFANAEKLVTIRKLIVSATTPSLQFTGCSKLKNITVEGVIGAGWNLSASPLSGDTVQHLIDHLQDRAGLSTQTLTLKNAVGAALSAAQKATITAKNWTLVY